MQKISDFFAVEAFYDDSTGANIFHFFWDEGDEKYVWNYDTDTLLEGDIDNFTWDVIIKDWYEANKEEVDDMIKTHNIHYVKDIIK